METNQCIYDYFNNNQNKINFEQKWESSEWNNLETHTQHLSKQKFTNFLLSNLQIREIQSNLIMTEAEIDIFNKSQNNKNIDLVNKKLIFI
jgi:hypothetical protein